MDVKYNLQITRVLVFEEVLNAEQLLKNTIEIFIQNKINVLKNKSTGSKSHYFPLMG